MKRTSLVLVFALTIAACGGSGGGGGAAAPNPSAALKIDSSNAMPVTRAAYSAASQSVGIGELFGSSGLVASDPGSVPKAAVDMATQAARSLKSIPVGPETQACAVSGTVTISGNIASPTTLTAGDNFAVDSDSCDDGTGQIVDGLLEFSVDAFSGDVVAGLYDMRITLTLTDFQITTPEDVITSGGGASVSLNTLSAPSVSASVNGTRLTTNTNSSSETMSNFASTQTLDAGISPSPFTMTASGTLDTTRLSGSISYSTPVTFEGFDTDYPESGEMLVTGDSSSARLIAGDNDQVTIEIDTDGNGTVDETIVTTWQELETL